MTMDPNGKRFRMLSEVLLLDEDGERICAVPAQSITDRDGYVEEELEL